MRRRDYPYLKGLNCFTMKEEKIIKTEPVKEPNSPSTTKPQEPIKSPPKKDPDIVEPERKIKPGEKDYLKDSK